MTRARSRGCIALELMSVLLLPGTSLAGDKPGATVTVKMSKFHNDKGQVLLGLFSSKNPKVFPSKFERAARHGKTTIKGRKAVYAFKDVTPGEWAIAVVHDENKNGKMDTNWLGIPKEGYGASRNPRPRIGAPDFKDAKFTVKKTDRAFKILMLY